MAQAGGARMPRLMISFLAGSLRGVGIPALAQSVVSDAIQQSIPGIAANISSPDPAAVASLRRLDSLCLHLCTPNINDAFQKIHVTYDQQTTVGTTYEVI